MRKLCPLLMIAKAESQTCMKEGCAFWVKDEMRAGTDSFGHALFHAACSISKHDPTEDK